MIRSARLPVTLASLIVLLVSGAALRADEVCTVLIVGITEGPDPIPRVVWVPVDHVHPRPDLAPDRSDGRPDVSLDPVARPVVAWAHTSSAGDDVALLRWNGSAWGPVQFVTATSAVERDPRAFVSAGDTVHVVWWAQESADRVYYVQSSGQGSFGTPQTVATDARRPSVAVAAGEALVAYERISSPGRQQIVLATRGTLGGFRMTNLFEVQHALPLDVVLHSEQGRLWIDWKASDTTIAWSERINGVWTAPHTLPWTDPSWAGTEDVRRQIREIVLSR